MTTVWDPAGEIISGEKFKTDLDELEQKLREFQAHPATIQKKSSIFMAIGVAAVIVAVWLASVMANVQIVFYSIVGFAPFFLYHHKIRKLESDLIHVLIAKSHNWLYAPQEDKNRWKGMAEKFPNILSVGNWGSQDLEDQFWGSAVFSGVTTDFWSGIFNFTVGSGKSKQTYRQLVFALHLPRHLSHVLYLRPQEGTLFGGNDIQTEWDAFNKAFLIKSWAQQGSGEVEAMQTLSPAVQQRLMTLKEKRGSFSLLFQNDVMMIRFYARQKDQHKTDFFKAVALDPRDEAELYAKINELLELNADILRFLD